MTKQQRAFLRWAHQQPSVCQEAILAGRAAVMPIKDVAIAHGSGEFFASDRPEIMRWAEKSLSARLDTAPK